MSELIQTLLGMVLVAISLGLFVASAILRHLMMKEVKKGKVVFWNNFLPYLNAGDFTEKGNKHRKTYNKIFGALIVCFVGIFAFRKFYSV